jgi:hypothetical protein
MAAFGCHLSGNASLDIHHHQTAGDKSAQPYRMIRSQKNRPYFLDGLTGLR